MILILIVIVLLCILFIWLWFKFIKVPKLNNINFISGALGTGKSLVSFRFGEQKFRWRVFTQNCIRILYYYKVHNLILIKKWREKVKDKVLNGEDIKLYTDIPCDLRKLHIRQFDLKESLNQKKKVYYKVLFSEQITKEHCLREVRFNYKSIVVFDEISIFFDQFDFDDKIINEKLNNFFKLFRHETKGGMMIINSQSINDCHFALKNCLSQYFYLHHKKKLLFFMWEYIQELQYSNDNNVINVNEGDIEETAKLKLLLVPKKVFKTYDTYAHSWLTDYCEHYSLPYSVEFRNKSRNLWTFKVMSSLFDNVPHCELNEVQLDYLKKSDIYKKSYMLKKYKDLEKLRKEAEEYDKKDA